MHKAGLPPGAWQEDGTELLAVTAESGERVGPEGASLLAAGGAGDPAYGDATSTPSARRSKWARFQVRMTSARAFRAQAKIITS